jgi:predicted Zn-dependent peptidase
MLDRTIPPPFKTIEKIEIPEVKTKLLDNGIPLHYLNVGTQPLIKIEFFFRCGSNLEKKRGVAASAMKMLLAGTSKYTSSEISDFFDNLGAFCETDVELERGLIGVIILKKHFPKILHFILHLLEESTFPEEEWKIEQQKSIQSLLLNLEKTNFLARQYFRERLFGKDHHFGKKTTLEELQNIDVEDIREHYQNYIQHKKFEIFIGGQVDESEISLINQVFGTQKRTEPLNNFEYLAPQTSLETNFYVEMPNKLQTSFCMGQICFNKKHPDFLPLRILHVIFGGYFGSRLMKNIREDKGYTYGINAQIVSLPETGYQVILADVKKEFYQNVLQEIHKESKILREELITEKELTTVKNYMLGKWADSVGNSFDLIELFKAIYFWGLDYSYYQNYINTIKNITPEELLILAKKYLVTENMLCVGVG